MQNKTQFLLKLKTMITERKFYIEDMYVINKEIIINKFKSPF